MRGKNSKNAKIENVPAEMKTCVSLPNKKLKALRGRFELPRDIRSHGLSRPAPYRSRLPQHKTVLLIIAR